MALCVNPNEEYAKVKAADGYVYYMASALLDTVLGKLAKDGEADLRKYWRPTKVRIWKAKNMRHCISVQQIWLQSSTRKVIM